MPLNIKKLISESGRYLIIGFSSAAIELGLFWILYELVGFRTIVSPLGVTLLLSNVIAILLATLFNFVMNYKWTFKSSSHIARSATLFILLFVFNQIFSNVAIVFLLNNGTNSMLAKVITMACIVCWNFFLYRFVVFK